MLLARLSTRVTPRRKGKGKRVIGRIKRRKEKIANGETRKNRGQSRVEAGYNTSTVALRIIRSDKKVTQSRGV
jgi:hypothetical protein